MKRKKELLIYDNAIKLYHHLGLSGDCIENKNEFSILKLGNFPISVPYNSSIFRANFNSFVFVKNSKGTCSSDVDDMPHLYLKSKHTKMQTMQKRVNPVMYTSKGISNAITGKTSFLVFRHNKYFIVPTESIAFFYVKYESTIIVKLPVPKEKVSGFLHWLENRLSSIRI